MKSALASRRWARRRSTLAGNQNQHAPTWRQVGRSSRFRLTPLAVALGAAMGLPAAHGQQIVVDGRTATNLAISGSVTDVRTNTRIGSNAFNSFRKFDVNAGNTVNLHVPNGAANLLNLISSASASRIDGMLNAIKNGQIGGNVFLANPEGVIVGSSGVINVGSLTLLAPSHAFVDGFFDSPGAPNAGAVSQMLSGTVPINPNGLIRVQGKVNVKGDATLRGGNVAVDGVIQSGALFTNTQVDFSDVVNTTDIKAGSAVIVQNGKIQIVAMNDVAISGIVAANGGNGIGAGAIDIRAGHDLELNDGTFLSVSGRGEHSSGGTIFAWADNNTALRHGSLLRADGGEISGAGGAIEVSAKKRLTLGGGALSAVATNGMDGSILFDPEDIEIEWDLLRGEATALPQGVWWNAGSLTLEADNTITLASGVVLSTRQVTVGSAQTARDAHINNNSTGDSGDVTISARSIMLEDGSMILAHASTGHQAGDITITATDNADDPFFGSLDDQTAGIALHGATLKGGKITLSATANDVYDWGVDSKIGTYLLKQLENAAYTIDASLSQAKASILLDGGASIVASGDVEITSKASSEASMRVLSPNGFGAGYGRSTASATTDIVDASIDSNGSVTISADGSAATDVIVNTQNVGKTTSLLLDASKYIDLAVAISEANLDSRAVVGSAATINAGQAVTVQAVGKKTANANATGGAYDDGTFGAAIAFSSYTANVTAAIDGKVQDASSVSVTADLTTAGANNSIGANSGSGSGAFGSKVRNLSVNAQLSDAVSLIQHSLMGSVVTSPNSPVTGKSLGLAASFLSLDQDNNVEARIGAGANVKSRGAVTVNAHAEDIVSYRSAAQVDQAVSGNGSEKSKAAKEVALSAAVALVDLDNHTKAYIGDNAVVNAGGAITVNAHSDVPVPLSLWGDWSDVSDFESGAVRLADLLSSNTFSVITGWTQAGVESKKLGVSGSFNTFDLENTADAWIGKGARINVGQAFGNTGDVTVSATTSQGTINLAGVFGFKFFPGTNQGPGIGGALANMNFVDRASATIGAGAMVQAADLTVEAYTESNNLTIAEAGGKSTSSVAFDASVALVEVNNKTQALIDSSATILALGDLALKAEDTSRNITIAGGFSVGSNAVGVGVAIDEITRDTRAAFVRTTAVMPASISLSAPVANTFTLPPGTTLLPGQALVYHAGPGGAIPGLTDGAVYYAVIPDPAHPDQIQLSNTAANAASGVVSVLGSAIGSGHSLATTSVVSSGGAVTLDARTRGFLSSTAVAAAYVEDQKAPDADPPADITKSPETKGDYDARQQRIADHGAKMQARWGVGISGGASFATVHETTEASLTGVRVDEATNLKVAATNSSDVYTAAGAFAISKSKGSVPGIAGSYARNVSDNATKAFVTDSTIESSGAVQLLADTSDSSMYSVSVGLGFSSKSSGIAGAVSVNTISDETFASIDGGSDVHGASVSLQANDGASIFALAGTVSVAGKEGTGFGGSLAINEISNHSTARVLDSDVEASNGGILIAQRAAQDIESIAVSAGGSQKGLALNFGVSINEIDSTDEAYVKGRKAVGLKAAQDIEVSAADDSDIDTYAAGLAISTQSSAGGGAGVYSAIGNEVSAYLDGAKAQSTSGNLLVKATSDDDIFTFVAGAAGGQSNGIAGSVAVSRVDTNTKAWLTGADVDVDGGVVVIADADFNFDAWGGALGVGKDAGFGGTVGVNLLYGDTSAWIGGASKVDTDGNDFVIVPVLSLDGSSQSRGVAVQARTIQHAESWLVSGGFGSSFGIGLTGSGNEATSQTTAYIDGGSAINSRSQADANAAQSVRIDALSDTRYVGRLGSIAGSGGTAIGATAAVGLINTGTRAYIDNAKVYAKDDIAVVANAKESLEAAGVTAGLGGDVGLAGTVFVTLINSTSEAYIRNADTIKAGGDLDVKAIDRVEIGGDDTGGLLGGAMAVSGGVAVGAAVSSVSIGNTTRAYMTDVKSDAAGTTSVKAVASQELHTGLLGISVGTAVAISASVVVTDIATSTNAYISQTKAGGTIINADTASAGAAQDVMVGADSTTEVNTNIFSAGGAVANGGASVDVTSIRNDVSAVIGAGVEAHAKHDVGVKVDSRHTVDSLVVAFGGGVGVAQGAVSIANIGSSMSDYSSEQSADASSTSAGQGTDAKNMMGFEGEGSYQPTGAFDKSAAPGGTTALIDVGAKITAGNNISVAAANTIEVDLVPGAGTASVGAIGAGIGLANLRPQVIAKVGNNAELNAGALIDVGADAKIFSSNVDAYAAGVGAAVISAAVAIIDSDANVEASLGDSVKITDADSVKVHAGRFNEQRAEAWGLSLGGAGAIGASVAESNSSGTTKAHVGNAADLSKAGALQVIAGNTAGSSYGNSAYAVAGAGGGLVGASGAEARAISSGDIYATTGTGVKLPTGNVVLGAVRQSVQDSETFGVTAGGYLAIGVTISRSESSGLTKAELGANSVTGEGREGDLLVNALASDTNHAKSVAGSGGAVAGNGAEASTTDNSAVHAGIAASTAGAPVLYSGAVTLQALHVSTYAGEADSVNAALVGASGSNVMNDLTADAQAKIGSGVQIVAGDVVAAGARNEFYSAVGGDSATGAAGGVLSGSAAVSSTDITSTTTTELGTGVDLASGTDPMSRPGGILLDASTIILASDRVQLTTGGAIAGAGTDSSIDATVSNNVRIGAGADLDSQGNIAAGTYTLASMRSESRASTWGLAGVGVSLARTTANIAENVTVGTGAGITAFGNVDLMAGDDPSGIYDSTVAGSADALAYVRGLVAIPLAYAESDLTSHAKLDIGAGAKVNSGQNVTIGAYNGLMNPVTNAEGHGFQLGFIPTENGNQGDGPSKTHTASVVNNGDVVAGYYHRLDIHIPTCATGSVSCAVNVEPGGAPFDWSYERYFNAPAFINATFGGAGAALIASGTSSTPVGAITLGTLFASGGNVTVNADTISGGGSITAHGAPTITVVNDSANYLVLGNVLIPNVPGGDVQFTGEAGETQAAAAGMAIHKETNQEGVITIHNAFDGTVGSSIYGPALFLMGDIENIGGKVLITNDRGSLGQAATIFGKEVQVKVPEGVAVIDIPNGTYYAGGNPYSEWQDFWFWPDDTPGNVTPGASAFFAGIFPGTNEQAPRNGATRYFISADCSGGDCYLTSVSPFRSYTFQSNSNNDANLDGSRRSSAIYGGKVLISAKYIDINGGITIGTDTDWSLNLAASLMDPVTNSYIGYPLNGGEIARADWLYANKLVSNPIFDLQTVTADAGDSRIGVKYDAQNKRILLDNVKASSDGGSLVLDGRILSTNGLGNIHVNGGLGDVDIDNQTGLAVVVRDVYAGNPGSRQSVVSTVDITDRNYANTSNHWIYNYTPQDGLAVYNGALNSSLDDGNMTLVSSGGSSSRLYQPLSGLRWMWEQVAFMNIAPPIVPPGTNTSLENWGNYLNVGPWSWEMPAGQPNNPWQYVAWNDNGTRTGTLSTTPTGTLVAGGAGQPVFSRTFSAQVTESWGFWTNTSGSQNFWFDNANPHTLFYPEQVKYTVTSSLKADNPIAIDFSGSAQSRVAINSKGNVSLTGTITNPGGPTTISADGSVTQAAGASIQTDSLVISATAGIGSSLQPIVSRLAPEGLVKAAGGAEGIFLALNGGRIQEVVAKKAGVEQYGDVVISALDDLVMESGGAGAIIGANVTLSSLLGGVGTGTDPIRMSAMGASGQSGVVNVSARGGIHLHDSTAHDFLVGEIASTMGDISIEVPNGSIMNASEQTSAQALSEDQVQQVWKDLKLIRGAGADGAEERGSASAHSVVAFQNMIESQHARYWDMIGDGTVVDGKFVLNSDAATVAKYSERAAAAGTTVQQFAEDRYAELAGSFSENVGADWQTRAAFVQAPAEGDAAFRFVASQAQIDALTRESGWTAEELNYSVSEVALQSRSAPVGSGQPNIIGHHIRLVAGGSIGRLAEPVDITLDQVADGMLSATQKAALALAKAPGDIVRLGKDADGNFVPYQLAKKPNGDTDYDSIPAGVTAYGFRIAQTSPLFLEMTGALNAEAGDALFVQAVLPTLTIDHVKAGGTAGLVSIENIVAATLRTQPGSPLLETGADLRLTAGSGSLGATGAALTLKVGGKLVSASAGQDAFLTGEGNLTFDRVVAGDEVVLKSNGGSLLAGEGVAINARGISLEADGDIGFAQSPVIVQIDGPGALSAKAGGSATVQGMGATFNVSTFEAGADASLAASGHLEAASVTGGGAVALAAGGNLLATQVSSGAGAHAEATGDIAIETLASGGGAGFVAGGNVQADTITSGGDTTIDAAGNVTAGTLNSGGAVRFVSGGAVQANAVTSTGNATIDAAGNVGVGTLDSGGAIDFQSGGDMGIGILTAAGAASLTSQGFLLSTAVPGGVNVTAANIKLMSNGADIGAASKYFVIEDLGITNATAFRDIYLEQRNRSLNAGLLASADGSVNVLAGTGDATIARIAAPGAVNVRLASSGTLHIADLDPSTANLAVDGHGGAIDVDSALIAQSLTASASTITLDNVQQVGGSGPLRLVLQGARGGIANAIDADIISANDVTIDRLAAGNALIDANVSNLWIENGRIVSFGRFSNEAFTATIDNFNHVRYDSDLQLFAPGQFHLRFFADARFETNALAIDYGDDFRVNGMGSGNSVTRFIPRLLTLVGLSRESGRVDKETPETGLVTWSSSALIPDDAITAIEQLEVNRR